MLRLTWHHQTIEEIFALDLTEALIKHIAWAILIVLRRAHKLGF